MPYESDDLYWADVLKYLEATDKRRETKYREKMNEYLMLINIHRSENPAKVYREIQSNIQREFKTKGNPENGINKLRGILEESRGRSIWQQQRQIM